MDCPDGVKKHDGRAVAFDAPKLAMSIARAAMSSDVTMTPDAAGKLAGEIAQAVASFLAAGSRRAVSTADVRALVIKSLRDIRNDAIADAYVEQARAAAGLLWRIRVVEPGMTLGATAGSP